jgi:hypothetical protein
VEGGQEKEAMKLCKGSHLGCSVIKPLLRSLIQKRADFGIEDEITESSKIQAPEKFQEPSSKTCAPVI